MTRNPQPKPDTLAVHMPPARTSALVTGAGSGIGRAVARALFERGERLILNGRQATALEETLPASDRVAHLIADAGDNTALAAAIAPCVAAQGPVSIAVLSAGVNTFGTFLDTPADAFDAMTRSNFTGVANILRLVLPGMYSLRHGRVVVIGTLADMNPVAGAVGYSATKGALHPLVRGIAGEIDRTRYPDILINEMTPGPVHGRMADFGRKPEDVVPEVLQLIDLPPHGASGGFFRAGRRLYPGETLKGAVKRRLRRLI